MLSVSLRRIEHPNNTPSLLTYVRFKNLGHEPSKIISYLQSVITVTTFLIK